MVQEHAVIMPALKSGAKFWARLMRQSIVLHFQFPPRWQVFPDSAFLFWAGLVLFEGFLVVPLGLQGDVHGAFMAGLFTGAPFVASYLVVPNRRWSVAFLWSMNALSLVSMAVMAVAPLPSLDAAFSVLFVLTALRMMIDSFRRIKN